MGATFNSHIMALPDAPQTTSAPASVRGIDRQESSETRLRLDTSQSIQRRSVQVASNRYIKPKIGFRVVLGHTTTPEVQTPEVVLRPGVTLLSSLAKPGCRLRIILGHTLTLVVQIPEAVLRVRVVLLSRLAIPKRSLSIVPMHDSCILAGLAVVVQIPEGVLRLGIALLSRLAKPKRRLRVMPGIPWPSADLLQALHCPGNVATDSLFAGGESSAKHRRVTLRRLSTKHRLCQPPSGITRFIVFGTAGNSCRRYWFSTGSRVLMIWLRD